MKISEKNVIEELVLNGELDQDIADDLLTVAHSESKIIVKPSEAEFTAISLLIDMSGSMNNLKNAVIKGQEHMISSLMGADQSLDILIGQTLFNDELHKLQECVPLRIMNKSSDITARDKKINFSISPELKMLNDNNYSPGGFTALYDAILSGISSLLPMYKMSQETAYPLSSIVCVLTDGKDEGPNGQPGSKINPLNLKKVIDFVLANSLITDIILAGIGDYDYKSIGNKIGVSRIIQVENNEQEIRKAFGTFSHIILETRKNV